MVKKTRPKDFNPYGKKTTIYDFDPDEIEIEDYVAHPLIPPGLTGLFAQPGSLKSWSLCQLAVDVSLGIDYLGTYPTNKRKVIYIDEDTPSKIYDNRLERTCNFYNKKISEIQINSMSKKDFDITSRACRNTLTDYILKEKAEGNRVLVIMDCLISICGSHLDIDRTENGRRLMSYFREISNYGADIIVSHHLSDKKDIDIFKYNIKSYFLGNTSIRAAMDNTIYMQNANLNDRTVAYMRPLGKRTDSNNKVVSVELFEDRPAKTKSNLRQIDEIPRLPSDDEIDVFKLFPYPQSNNTKFELTVFEMQKRLGGGYSQERLEEILVSLISEKVIAKIRYPGKTPSRVFCINPLINAVKTAFKDEIIK